MKGEGKGRPGCWMRNASILEKRTKLKSCSMDRTERKETNKSFLPSFFYPILPQLCGCFSIQPIMLSHFPPGECSLEMKEEESV